MLYIGFGKWDSSADRFFIRERYYFKGRWTPFCKLTLRYFRTVRMMHSSSPVPLPTPIDPINKCGFSILPMDLVDERGEVVETTVCDSISGNRGREDGINAGPTKR